MKNRKFYDLFLVRHGAHINNVLTERGVLEVGIATKWILDHLRRWETGTVLMHVSPQPRAIETKETISGLLAQGGVLPTHLDPQPGLDVASAVGKWLKESDHPYGQDGIAHWRQMTEDNELPEGVERFDDVAERVHKALTLQDGIYDRGTYEAVADHEVRIVVCHGGTIEPYLQQEYSMEVPDLPSGAVVAVSEGLPGEEMTFVVFDPASGI